MHEATARLPGFSWGLSDWPADAVFVDPDSQVPQPNGSRARPFLTIGDAIEAAPPDATIAVAEGDYDANVVFDRDLRLAAGCPGPARLRGRYTVAQGATVSLENVFMGSRSDATTLRVNGVLIANQVEIRGGIDRAILIGPTGRATFFNSSLGGDRTAVEVEGQFTAFRTTFEQPTGTGLHVHGSTASADVSWSDFRSSGTAILVDRSGVATVTASQLEWWRGNDAPTTDRILVRRQGELTLQGVQTDPRSARRPAEQLAWVRATEDAVLNIENVDLKNTELLGVIVEQGATVSLRELRISASPQESEALAGLVVRHGSEVDAELLKIDGQTLAGVWVEQNGVLRARRVVVKGSEEPHSAESTAFRVSSGGELHLEDALVTDQFSTGFAVWDTTSSVTLKRLRMRAIKGDEFIPVGLRVINTELRGEDIYLHDSVGLGVFATRNSVVGIERLTVAELSAYNDQPHAAVLAMGQSEVNLTDASFQNVHGAAVISIEEDTQIGLQRVSVNGVTGLGQGVFGDSGSRIAVDGIAIQNTPGPALWTNGRKSRITGSRVYIKDSGAAGIRVQNHASVELSDVDIADANAVGVRVVGNGIATLNRLVIRNSGSASEDNPRGGLNVETGAKMSVDTAWIEGNFRAGVVAHNAELSLKRTTVAATRLIPGDDAGGVGIVALDDTKLDIESVRIVDNAGAGILLDGSSELVGEGLRVETASGSEAEALVLHGGTADIRAFEFSVNGDYGVYLAEGAMLSLVDGSINGAGTSALLLQSEAEAATTDVSHDGPALETTCSDDTCRPSLDWEAVYLP